MMKAISFLFFLFLFSSPLYSQNLQSGLVGQYYFSGGTLSDLSGNNYHANFSSAIPTLDRFGNIDYAYSFNGNQYINVPYISEFGAENMSVSLWFRATNNSFGRIIALPFNGSPSWAVNYHSTTSTPLGVDFYAGFDQPSPWSPEFASADNIVGDGIWHFLVGIRDSVSKKMYIYIDCELIDSTIYQGNIYAPNSSLNIGRYDNSWGQYFTGDIDDIRIYNRNLISSEIDLLCNEINPILKLKIEDVISFNLYPNPAQSKLFIDFEKELQLNYKVEINSIAGKLIYSSNQIESVYNLADFESGIYFFRIINKATGKQVTKKFVKL